MSHFATCPLNPTFDAAHLGDLTRVVSPDLVDAALETTGTVEQRTRRLPSRIVVYLLLAGALFVGMGWRGVFARLAAVTASLSCVPAAASITQAMRRIGPAPLQALFDLLAGPGVSRPPGVPMFAGRLVAAIDGTELAIADTAANRAFAPKPAGGPNGEAGYPMIRLVTIVATGTRMLMAAVFGTASEIAYAGELFARLPEGLLILGDRNFSTRDLYTAITRAGSDFLIRGKTGKNALKLPIEHRLADGSFLSHAGPTAVRVIDARITMTTPDGGHDVDYRLITSLLDPTEAPASRLVALYHERWEIEIAYSELKSAMLDGRVLRGRYRQAVEQEIWAILAAYQALRTAMADTALTTRDVDPDRMSFTIALTVARDQITVHDRSTNASDLSGAIGHAVLDALLPSRRTRTRPRVIKRAISKYRAKARAIDRRTRPAHISVAILDKPPTPLT